MLTLRKLQNNLQQYLMNNDSAINHYIVQPEHDSVQNRLNIYAYAYRYRLIDILKGDFVALCTLLGDKKFEELATEYIDAHPSHYFTVRYFGSHFIQFLKNNSINKFEPYLIDMATFEWALVHTGDAADSPVITINDLAVIPQEQWGRLRFTEHPSLQTISLASNVPLIWHANAEKKELPAIEMYDTPSTWRLWRQGVQSYYFSMSDQEALTLSFLCQQKTFAEICEGLCDHLPEEEVPETAAQFLLRWLNEGILSSVTLAPEN
jgi:hypothetical protein